MDFDDVILSHPHDFFRNNHLGTIPGTCFILMPFGAEFNIVFDTIEEALKGLMICTRADDLKIGAPILERILRGISTADLIIADLTHRNANVFYELGLAHTRTKNVLLLTRNIEDLPFDLKNFFCQQYSVNSKHDLERLGEVVFLAAEEIRARTLPHRLKSALARTERIVSFMEQQLDAPKGVKGLVIRMQARVSSLGNTDRVIYSEPERIDYSELLEREGELLIKMIEQGASLQAIIWPHILSANARETNEERIARLDKLTDFIGQRQDLMARCQFVLSPTFGSNQLFFGEAVFFEGHKTEVERGFGWTQVYTDADYVAERIRVFDSLFESARLHTIQTYGESSTDKSDEEILRDAVLKTLIKAKSMLA